MDPDEALAQIEELIPAEVRMISGCRDEQTSAEVSAVGVCTTALLKILYADHHTPDEDLTFLEVLLAMRDVLSECGYTQIPQFSASRPLDLQTKFNIVPDDFSGTKLAVMIGINYVGLKCELSGCHNDVYNMKQYIMHVHGFQEENITLLLDDGVNILPTHDNIMNAFRWIVSVAQPGDAIFLHYSGHGGKLPDEDGDEKDGYDETLVPLDYWEAGQIRDDDIFSTLVGPMPRGVTVTSVMDSAHSGTVLDLPYVFIADGEHEGMEIPPEFDYSELQRLFQAFLSNRGNQDLAGAVVQECCAIL